MRRLALLLATLPALAAPSGCLKIPPELPQEPEGTPGVPSTAGEVLARYIERAGGEARLRALAARSIEARMVLRPQEGCEVGDQTCIAEEKVGSFLLRTTADGKLYRRTVLDEMVEEKGYDGKTGWNLAGEVVRLESAEELVLSKEDAVLHWYFDLEERGVQATLARPRKEDSQGTVGTLDGIHWELPGTGASPKTMWFDRKTGLLREETVEEGVGDEVQRQTIVYEDYRDIDGVAVPHMVRVINEVGAQEQIVEFVTQRVDHKPVDAKLFDLPTMPAPDPVPDQRIAALAQAKKAASEAKKDASAQVALTRAAWMAGDFETVKTAAKATLALDSKEPEAMLLLARSHVLSGELKEARSTLRKAASAGLKPEVIAVEEAWIHYRERDFNRLAKSLDAIGNPVLAGRFRTFVGKPLKAKAGKDCVSSTPLLLTSPLAVVEIEVDDEPVRAIVDSGASDLILSSTFASARGISIKPLSQGQGSPTVGYGQAEKLVVGDATLENVPVDVFDDRAMAEMAGTELEGVKAVLSLTMLSEFQVTVDVPGKKLELVDTASRCKSELAARRSDDSVPFWQHETHYLYVGGELRGAPGLYLLNTGMRGADITANLLAYAHAGIGIPPLRDGAAMGTVDGFSFGPIEGKGLQAAFGYTDANGQLRGFFERAETSSGFREDGMIGLAALAERSFTLDFDTRRIYFGKKD